MRSRVKRLVLTVLVATSLGTSGCLFGTSLSVTFFSGILSISVGDIDVGTCFDDEQDPAVHTCLNNGIFSTFETLTEAQLLFRLFLLDPLVIQVPEASTDFAASYSHMSGSGPLTITTATSLAIDANRTLAAGAGTKFVVIAFPDGAPTSGTFAFNFNFKPPPGATAIDAKPIITGYAKLTDGTEYFPPILPCVASMADAPTVTIPLPVPNDTLTLPTLTAALGCQNEVYDLIPSLVGPFMCYGAKPSAGAAKLPKGVQATVTDRFETNRQFDATKALALCTPATVGGAANPDAATRLEAFATKLAKATPKQPKHAPRVDLHVRNQFHPHGELVLDTKKATRLLVPTAAGATAPNPATHTVDHFDCYDVKVSKGDPKFPKNLTTTVVDAFAQPKTYALKKPARLCVAADRDGEDPGAASHADQLMCYRVKPAKTTPKQPKFAKVRGLAVANALASGQLDAVRDDEVCVPSSVAP